MNAAQRTGQATLRSLPSAARRLISLMQSLNYGHIEHLHLRDGLPQFDPPPRVIREVKFAGDNAPRRELDCADFVLKPQVLEFLAQCQEVGDGVVECLVVKAGLPFAMTFEDQSCWARHGTRSIDGRDHQ